MRAYNSCNCGFAVLYVFTIEEENKEAQASWCAESWESLKSFVGPLVVRSFGSQMVPAQPVTGSVILGKTLETFAISRMVHNK